MMEPTQDVETGSVHDARGDEGRWWTSARTHWLDVGLGLLGLGFGWASLWFPFGRDQGLYHYVARAWLHGAVPYRDVFDHKTPGIYMLHAVAIALFGENMWGIRVLELVAVLSTGLVAATFTAAPGERVQPGVRGATILTIGLLNYGLLNFWDQSQSEIWYSLLGLCSVWAVRRIRRESSAQIAGGAFGAAAVVMKPPAVWFMLVAFGAMLFRVRARVDERRWLRALLGSLRFAAGAAAVVVPVLGYFVLTNAMPDMIEIVVHTNAYYAAHETDVATLSDMVQRTLDFMDLFPLINPFFASTLALSTLAAAATRRWPLLARHLLAWALVAAAVAATAMQRKFYILHWSSLLGPATVIGALLAADLRLCFPHPRVRAVAQVFFIAALVACFAGEKGGRRWRNEQRNVVRYLRGQIERKVFARKFDYSAVGYDYRNSERAGLWIREHSDPNDLIAVRAFEPQIYAIARRRYPGRFFWTTYLTQPTRAEPERRARFRQEDERVLHETPPRYVVALDGAANDVDNPEYFYPLGYAPREQFGQFVVLEQTGKPYREGTH